MKVINYQWILIIGMEENEFGRDCERERGDILLVEYGDYRRRR